MHSSHWPFWLSPNVSGYPCRVALYPLRYKWLNSITGGRDKNSDEFRLFSKELYHHALTQILSPLRPAMLTPHVMKCPDGHFRCAIFELGPFIADYPEQVCLAGIVQGWCPKYVSELVD